MPLLRRARAAAVGAAVLVAALLTGANVATARPDDGPPAPECAADVAALRYVVLFNPGTTQPVAAEELTGACGELVVYYPQIAVAVATSTYERFADRIGRDRAFSAQQVVRARKSDETGSGAELVTANAAQVPIADRSAEQWDMSMINADAAHKISRGSRDVVVGVLDSGVDPNHPDLRGALDPTVSAGCLTGKPDPTPAAWRPTASPHGTHVAGTIAAADDGHGITGVAPGVRIASVKVVDDNGFILPEYAICGLMWASANRMTVTNNSYFVDPWLMTCNRDSERVVQEAVRRAVDHSTRQGVLTVAAATNEGVDLSRRPNNDCRVLPAGLRGVVAVSAVGPDKLKASYSSYGLGVVDVTAPGGEVATAGQRDGNKCVLSTVPGGYERYCGTSMAAPHATGVVALLASTHPNAPPQQLARMLTTQAEPIQCPADYDLHGTGAQDAYCSGYAPYNGFHGHGLVDALAAVGK
ncbi:MAG TPA: S8 family serine peptidase [Actinophytocola sp.]|uniref:S8 family peptidase n=1 Tax=Actinophytocola sp. TaxID=1872138 RepID=UPI002DDD7B51|nr:S8 family serine peptidase [Actinophytocola sp.]HEV2783864.1 S8 family serine peptidase [Actinophytocola sp.]